MIHVKQFRYSNDNLGYLLYGQQDAFVIDGGAVEAGTERDRINDLMRRIESISTGKGGGESQTSQPASNPNANADKVSG